MKTLGALFICALAVNCFAQPIVRNPATTNAVPPYVGNPTNTPVADYVLFSSGGTLSRWGPAGIPGTTTNINYYLYSTNIYNHDTYVSNYFTTNVWLDTYVSNFFVTNLTLLETNSYFTDYVTNVFNQYDYISNFWATNIFVNDTYVSNYYTTNQYFWTTNITYDTYTYYTNLYTTNLFVDYITNNYSYITNLYTSNAYITNITAKNVYITGMTVSTNAWAGPTNTINMALNWSYYATYTPCSITGLTGNDPAGLYVASQLLTISNAASTNITVYLPASVRTGDGARSYTITNATVGKISFEYAPIPSTNAVFRLFY